MKVRVGISTKLIMMVTTIIVLAIGVVVYEARELFSDASVRSFQEANADIAKSLGSEVVSILQQVVDQMQVMNNTVAQAKGQELSAEARELIKNVLQANDDMVDFAVYRYDGKEFKRFFFENSDTALSDLGIKPEDLRDKPEKLLIETMAKESGNVALLNTSPLLGKPVLTIGSYTQRSADGKERWLLRCDISQGSLIKLFKRRANVTAYMVGPGGQILVDSDLKRVFQNTSVSKLTIVQSATDKSSLPTQQLFFSDERGVRYYGAYHKIPIDGAAVIAQVTETHVFEAVRKVQHEAMLITVIVLGIAFLLNFVFSKSMTSPLGLLYEATERIAGGNFDVKLEPRSNDEIGALTSAFKKMATGLQERDKLKTTFNKFHSKEIADKLLSGEIKLGGEKKMATVFFSDIRNFTAMSETLTPDQVVQLLNEYMTDMVKVITKHHGVVDKYIGDAIMALWGVPKGSPDDARNAVAAALEMRKALKSFNQRRMSRGQSEIRIGIGIHTGEVLAGNIGSEERLEYTVIGDTVNQASRIEAATKELKTDLLISDTTFALVKSMGLVVGQPIPIKAKGKSNSLTVYQVIGRKEADGSLDTELTKAEQTAITEGVFEIIEQEERKVEIQGAKTHVKAKRQRTSDDEEDVPYDSTHVITQVHQRQPPPQEQQAPQQQPVQAPAAVPLQTQPVIVVQVPAYPPYPQANPYWASTQTGVNLYGQSVQPTQMQTMVQPQPANQAHAPVQTQSEFQFQTPGETHAMQNQAVQNLVRQSGAMQSPRPGHVPGSAPAHAHSDVTSDAAVPTGDATEISTPEAQPDSLRGGQQAQPKPGENSSSQVQFDQFIGTGTDFRFDNNATAAASAVRPSLSPTAMGADTAFSFDSGEEVQSPAPQVQEPASLGSGSSEETDLPGDKTFVTEPDPQESGESSGPKPPETFILDIEVEPKTGPAPTLEPEIEIVTESAPHANPRSAAPRPSLGVEPGDGERWYLVRDAHNPETEGPYTLKELRTIASQVGFPFDEAYAFRDGDAEMTLLSKVEGVSRRSEDLPPIQAALPSDEIRANAQADEWYIYGDEARTLGPYKIDDIRAALDSGHLTHTTYVWRSGMPSWIYLHEVDGFDRRGDDGTQIGSPPIPEGFKKVG